MLFSAKMEFDKDADIFRGKMNNARWQAISPADQQLARNLAMSVNYSEPCDNVIGLSLPIDDNIIRDDADAEIRPDGTTRRAALGMSGQMVQELCKTISEFTNRLSLYMTIQAG